MPDRTVPPTRPALLGARLAAEGREEAVRARFVREVLTHVPLARVAALYLFAPMRQGGVEGGVAVLAALPEPSSAAPPDVGDAAGRDIEGEARPPGTSPRLTVFSARYRLTVRGTDRGRWQVDVREEADAPLVTVEAVVRGVQRRAGDASAPTRLGAAAVAELVAAGPGTQVFVPKI